MNSNTFGEDDIPEAIEDLAGSLDAPDPAAIHAGLGKRQAVRRRVAGGAGAFVAVLAVAGGALALTNDTTTTATAADDSVEEPEGLIFEWEGSVADDSAPFEIDDSPTTPHMSVRQQLTQQRWRVDETRGVDQPFAPNGEVVFNADPDQYRLPRGVDTLSYTTECSGSAYTIEWATDIDYSESQPQRDYRSFTVLSELDAVPSSNPNCDQLTRVPVLTAGEIITIDLSARPSLLYMEVACPPLAVCVSGSIWAVQLSLGGQPRPIEAGVVIDECANGSTITLVATDGDGLTAPFVRNDGQGRVQPCMGFTYQQPADDAIIVSSGEPKSSVPNVEAIRADSAAQQLRAEGFEVLIDFVAVDDPSLLNVVLSQSPPPNSSPSGSPSTTTPQDGAADSWAMPAPTPRYRIWRRG